MRILTLFSALLILSACSSDPGDSTSTTDATQTTDTTPETTDDVDNTDEVTPDSVGTAEPDYPEQDHPEVVNVDIPECIMPDENGNAEGCAALPEHSIWNCPAGYEPSNSDLDLGCIPDNNACPDGEWASVAGNGTLYVQAGANGNGLTAESPLGSITEALDAVTGSIDTILVAKGSYNEQVINDKGVLIKGACATETFLSYSDSANYEYGVVLRDVGAPGIEGFTILGNSTGVAVIDSSYAVINNVMIRGKRGYGILVQNREGDDSVEQVVLDINGVLITRTMEEEGQTSSSLYAGPGTAITATELLIEGGDALGIDLDDSELTLNSSAVADTKAFALRALNGSNVEMNNVILDANTGSGLEFWDSSLSATDLTVSNTGPSSASFAGDGMFFYGSSVTATRVAMSGNHNSGIYAFGIGSDADFTDLTISMTQPEQANQKWGNGLYVMKGANVDVDRGTFSHNHHIGVVVEGRNTSLNLNDSLVNQTQAEVRSEDYGVGLWAMNGAQVQLTEVVVLANQTTGIVALGDEALCGNLDQEACEASQTNVRMRNVIVQDTQPDQSGDNEGTLGTGIHVDEGAQMEGRKIIAKGNHFAGIWVQGKGMIESVESVEEADEVSHIENRLVRSTAHFTEIAIEDTYLEPATGKSGVGFLVTSGGKGSVEKGIIARCHTAGALSSVASIEAVENALGSIASVEAVEEGNEVGEVSELSMITEFTLKGVHIVEIYQDAEGMHGDGVQVIGVAPEFGELAELSELSSVEMGAKGSVENSVIEMTTGNSVSAYQPMGSVEMSGSVAKGRLAVGAVEAVEEGLNSELENGSDGLAAMHGGSIIATNSVIEQQSRCAVLVQDDPAIGENSSVELSGVQIFNNAIGVNVVSDSFDEEDAFASVERSGNSEDSASVEVTVDGASAIEMSGAVGMLSSVEMAPAHGAVGAVGAVGAIGAIE